MRKLIICSALLSILTLSACKNSAEEQAKKDVDNALKQAQKVAADANQQSQKAMEEANTMMNSAMNDANKQMEQAQKQIKAATDAVKATPGH